MLITHANLITWKTPDCLLQDQALLIRDGLVAEMGPSAELEARYPYDRHPTLERLDAKQQMVMPGNICAHTHFYGAFARGMAISGEAPAEFAHILQQLWWPLDQSLSAEDVYYSTLVCLIDAIRHGTTTLFDHHASPNALDGSLDVIAEAVQQAGVRAVLCYEVTDRYGPQKATAGIRENVRFLERLAAASPSHPSLLAGSFGLHAPLTISNATLEACRSAAPEGAGFHLHISESQDDRQAVIARGHKNPVDWLNRCGILGPKTIAAHCVHVDQEEIQQLASTGTWVTHQPRSNMNNAVGVAAVEEMLAAGVKVCLGNDGFSNAMWAEWKAAYLLHKIEHRDARRMNGNMVTQMAIHNNAALANLYFPQAAIGVIQPGAVADLIFVQYHSPTPLSSDNLPWHILFGFHESMITTTIVHGKILMKDRQLLTLDEEAISARAREQSQKVWERYQQNAA